MNNRTLFFGIIYVLSFFLLIINLNYNVKTFRLTQELQTLTLKLQALERDVNLKELTYYTKTSLDKVYEKAKNTLGMIRQDAVYVFSNDDIKSR